MPSDDFAQFAVRRHIEHVVCPRVFDVASQIRDLVGDLYDAAFPRIRLYDARPLYRIEIDRFSPRHDALLIDFAAVADKPVSHRIRQIERLFYPVGIGKRFDIVCKKKTVPLVPKFFRRVRARFLFKQRIEAIFSVMTERRMSDIVTDRDCSGKLFVQAEIFCDFGCDRSDVQYVFHARTGVIVVRRKKNLRFML